MHEPGVARAQARSFVAEGTVVLAPHQKHGRYLVQRLSLGHREARQGKCPPPASRRSS